MTYLFSRTLSASVAPTQKKRIAKSVFILPLVFSVFISINVNAQTIAEKVFTGEHIITMDGSSVAAVAIAGDRIIATGSLNSIDTLITSATEVVELGERALLPGFIDAHGHFAGVARNSDFLDLSSPPVGNVNTIDDIVLALRNWIESKQIPAGEIISGFGYDDSLLAENRHPTRADLDRASTRHPIILRHVSGHLSASNSNALMLAGINASTENPPGGVIRRVTGGNEPNGVMEETAMRLLPAAASDPARMSELLRGAIDIYASYGITTIQDGGTSQDLFAMLQQEAAREAFAIDVVSYLSANNLSEEVLGAIEADDYVNGFRTGGVKFMLDGSPQGRTAWLSQPYDQGPPGESADYRAYPNYEPEKYIERMKGLLSRGVPVLAHANGDAAIDLMIDGVDSALATIAANENGRVPDHRSVTIHAQLMRPDQLDRIQGMGIVPSYYAVHPYFWGDWHRLSFGEERAAFISPMQATLDRGIPFTIHNDSPVVPPDMMRLLWIATNRETRSGHVLGPDQRLSIEAALHSVTLGSAYQYFEEDNKGSITPGKQADLVILERNPLDVPIGDIKDIQVVETIARGKTVFKLSD